MGSAQVEIHPTTRPSIDVTSAFNPGSQNTIYQTTTPGALLPLAYDFLLWDGDGMALTGVEIAQSADPARALLVQAGLEIGNVMIDAPSGASDFGVFTLEPSELINAPVSLVETGRLTAFFRTGSVAGDYELLFSLNGGNSVKMFVTAVPEPPSIALTGIGLLGVMMICGHRRLQRLTGAE